MSGTLAELALLGLLGAELVLFAGAQIYLSFRHGPRTSGHFALGAGLVVYLTMGPLTIANLGHMPDASARGAIALVSLIPAGAWGVLALILHLGASAMKRRGLPAAD